MLKIIIFGDLPIATKVAKLVISNKHFLLSGVVIGNKNPSNNDPWDEELLYDFAVNNGVSIFDLNDLKDSNVIFDYGLSCRFSKKIKQDVLCKFSQGIINFHGGLLPEYAGLYSSVHSLLNKDSIGGGTLHWMLEEIDTGNIIKRCEFPIVDNDTAFTVFQKTQLALLDGFQSIISDMVDKKISSQPIEFYINRGHKSNYYDKKSLDDLRLVKIDELLTGSCMNVVKAFTFPGYPSSFLMVNDKKLNITVSVD